MNLNCPSPALSFDEAMIRCTNMLQSRYSPEESLEEYLKIIGEFYQSDATFLFEFDEMEQSFFSCNQWFSTKSCPRLKGFCTINFSSVDEFSMITMENSKLDVFYLETKSDLNNYLEKELDLLGIQSLNLVSLPTKSKKKFYVGLANLRLEDFDSSLLECVLLFIEEWMEKREMHHQLSVLHHSDPLTGVLNKTEVEKKFLQLKENPPKRLGVLRVQVSKLERISEVFGEKYVDVQIKNVVASFSDRIDYPFYRVTRHQFLSFITDKRELEFSAIVENMRQNAKIHQESCYNVGHVWYDNQEEVKKEFCSYDFWGFMEKMNRMVEATLSSPKDYLLEELKKGIVEDDFVVHLQAKVVLSSHKLAGAEALVRRKQSDSAVLIPPEDFVPLYENHGIIRFLDLHVLEKVCAQMAEWEKVDVTLKISVNFSRVTLLEAGIAKEVFAICEKYQVSPTMLEFEISKTTALKKEVVDEFHALGFNLVLDDFGTRHSNFQSLASVDIDEIKIDKTLVENMQSSRKKQKNLKTIIELCNMIGNTPASAGGIETQQQEDILLGMNCTYGQGYYFSYPLSMDEFYQKYFTEE